MTLDYVNSTSSTEQKGLAYWTKKMSNSTGAEAAANPDRFVYHQLFTPNFYHDVYPSIQPESQQLKQDGRVILITGASGPIASVSTLQLRWHYVQFQIASTGRVKSQHIAHLAIGTREIFRKGWSESNYPNRSSSRGVGVVEKRNHKHQLSSQDRLHSRGLDVRRRCQQPME
jgi:hypothetical protein